MDSGLTIGRLARAVAVPVSTVRYYERARLLKPEGRTGGNYRLYGPDSLDRLRFIRAAQAVGFTIKDVSRLLAFRDRPTAPCGEVQALIEARLGEIRRRMEDLRHARSVLVRWLEACRKRAKTGQCVVLDSLRLASRKPRRESP